MAQQQCRATRADDERVLMMLAMRQNGFTSIEIGATFGMKPNAVRTTMQRIDRDLAASERRGTSIGWGLPA